MAKGRKSIDEEPITETISIRFTKKELAKIEKIAKDLDMPKTRLVRNLALSTLDEVSVLNSIGFLKGLQNLIDFKDKFAKREKLQNISTHS